MSMHIIPSPPAEESHEQRLNLAGRELYVEVHVPFAKVSSAVKLYGSCYKLDI